MARVDRGWRVHVEGAIAALLLVGIWLGLNVPPAVAQAPTVDLKFAKPSSSKRVALVVGMSRYQHIPALDNPKNDATLIANTLRDVGFTLVGGGAQLDLDKVGFDRAVQQFGQQIIGADAALFYYAGHGLQVSGVNWLVPTTANPAREADLDFQMVDANLVLRQMESAGTKLNLMILDACRNNPFGGRGLRSAAGGLAQMKAPEGTLISYATQPGNVAADGADGNSPFTKALARTMKQPGLDVFKLFNQVGLQVKQVTAGAQQPWVSNSPIDGDFYFMQVPTGSTVTVSPPGAAASSAAADRDALFWASVKDSRNQAEIQAYLDQFPQGTFAGLARVVLKDLKKGQVAAVPTKPDVAPAPTGSGPAPAPRAGINLEKLRDEITAELATAISVPFMGKFSMTTKLARLSQSEIVFEQTNRFLAQPNMGRTTLVSLRRGMKYMLQAAASGNEFFVAQAICIACIEAGQNDNAMVQIATTSQASANRLISLFSNWLALDGATTPAGTRK